MKMYKTRHNQQNKGVSPCKILLLLVALGTLFSFVYLFNKNTGSRITRGSLHETKNKYVDPLEELLEEGGGDESKGGGEMDEEEASFIKNDLLPDEKRGATRAMEGHDSTTGSQVLVFKGADGVTAYLGTVKFKRDKQQPLVDNNPHSSSYAFFGNGQRVLLHLTSPSGDPYWYVSLRELMKKDSKGKNTTPIIAFTSCDDPSVYPWLPESRCAWTVHEGPEAGWRQKKDLSLVLQG